MKTVSILDVVRIDNQSVNEFRGKKKYVATGDVSENKISSFTDISYDNRPARANIQVKPGQAIFARMQGTKKVLTIDKSNDDYIYSTGFCVLEPSELILTDYLEIILKSDLFQNQKDKYSKGATQKAINNDGIKKIQVPLPSLEIQKKIVAVLNNAKNLIDARKEQIRLMDELIQSLFYEIFGDPVTNPKGWPKIQLGKSCNIITGNTPSRKEPDNYGDYIEWIKSDNINTPNTYLTCADEYLSIKGFEKGRYTESDTILMTCIAGSLSCIGNVAITDRRVAFNQQINAIVPQKYETMFLYVMFLLTKNYIQNASSNSMKGMISKGKLQELEFILPDRTTQVNYASKVTSFENQKKLFKNSLVELETHYLVLTQKAFAGNLI